MWGDKWGKLGSESGGRVKEKQKETEKGKAGTESGYKPRSCSGPGGQGGHAVVATLIITCYRHPRTHPQTL